MNILWRQPWRHTAAAKRPRTTPKIDTICLYIQGDSSLVCGWLNGTCRASNPRFLPVIKRVQMQLKNMWDKGLVRTAQEGGCWLNWQYRELNKGADSLCNECMDRKRNLAYDYSSTVEPMEWQHLRLQCYFDGGKRSSTKAAAAFLIMMQTGTNTWAVWKGFAVYLEDITSTTAELLAASELVNYLSMLTATNLPMSWRSQPSDIASAISRGPLPHRKSKRGIRRPIRLTAEEEEGQARAVRARPTL